MIKNRNSINFIIIEKSYLIRRSLSDFLLEKYKNIQLFDEIEDFDSLLSLIEKSSLSCIFIDINTIEKYKRYLHTIPENSIIIPIFESKTEHEKYSNFKSYISIFDEKKQILETIQRAINYISTKIPAQHQLNELSKREKIVLQLIAKGFSSKVIADKLGISIQTVSTHRKNISGKLNIKTLSGLTVYAIINNLIKIEEN